MKAKFREITFSDSDIVNLDDWIPAGEYNPHHKRPWLIHDHGFTVAVVFADHEQDALDEAVDAGKLDPWQVTPEEEKDYPEGEGLAFLGNAGEPFDLEGLEIVELPNPGRSFVAQFVESFGKQIWWSNRK